MISVLSIEIQLCLDQSLEMLHALYHVNKVRLPPPLLEWGIKMGFPPDAILCFMSYFCSFLLNSDPHTRALEHAKSSSKTSPNLPN